MFLIFLPSVLINYSGNRSYDNIVLIYTAYYTLALNAHCLHIACTLLAHHKYISFIKDDYKCIGSLHTVCVYVPPFIGCV